ncbi:MAG: PorP/SprF family type IX secretion system membrane protein [Muribaculaceae bacterium]|nr:PorP/SprF family type IX secretion system membrane protein [Muribaculaceae bacterium]
MKAARHIIALITILVMTHLAATAQVDAQLTQYWAVPAYYNPAATGNIDFIHISAGARLQWVGVRHAPMTFMAMADMPFKFLGRRWGTGVVLQQESMGLYKSVHAHAQLAWKKKMLGGTLSVGLQPGIINQSFDGTKKELPEGDEYHQGTDDAIPATVVSGTAFDISGGVMFTHKWFWASASVAHITAPTIKMKVENDEEKLYEFDAGRVFYFMAGSNIPIKNTLFEVMPSVMVKSDLQFLQAEATARVRYNKFLSLGVGYRYKDAVSFMVGADYKNFFFGYSYDYTTSAIRTSGGSHEVFLQYNVKLDMGEKNRNSHKSIRIM